MKRPRVWDSPTTELIYEYTDNNKVWILLCRYTFTYTPVGVFEKTSEPVERFHVALMINAEEEHQFCESFDTREAAMVFIEAVKSRKIKFETKFDVKMNKWRWSWVLLP